LKRPEMKTLTKPSILVRTIRATLFVAALGVPAVAFAVGEGGKVVIDNFAFTPATVTVKPGTTVTFENHDDIPHSVVDVAGKFHSKALDTNDTFQVTFDLPGEYNYYCGLHAHMKGKIVVAP
jgi:plastocyanin